MQRRNRIPDEDALIEEGRNTRDFRGSRKGTPESPAGKKMNPGWQEATNTRKLNTKEDCSYTVWGHYHKDLFFYLFNAALNPLLSGNKYPQEKVIKSRQEEMNADVACFGGDLRQEKPCIRGNVYSYTNSKFRLKWKLLVSLTTQLCHVMFYWTLSCERSCDALLKTDT